MIFKDKTIGIIGGGQLGMMTAIAAKRLGYQTLLYCPRGDNPAEYSVNDYIDGDWDDNKKLKIFASKVDVITSEFENVPAKTLDKLFIEKKPVDSQKCFQDIFRVNKSSYCYL